MAWHRRDTAARAGSPPSWPDEHSEGARRVLVEHPEPAARELIARGLRERGYAVVACGGPDGHGDTATDRCPVLHGEPCPGVDGADVVVSSLNLSGQRERTIVRTIAADPASPPVFLEASDWQLANVFGDHADVSHHYPFTSVDQIAAAIEGLVRSR